MKCFLCTLFVCAVGFSAARTFAAPIGVTGVTKDSDGVTFAMSPGTMKLTVCSDGIVRVMYSPTTTLPVGQNFAVTNHSWPRVAFKVAQRLN